MTEKSTICYTYGSPTSVRDDNKNTVISKDSEWNEWGLRNPLHITPMDLSLTFEMTIKHVLYKIKINMKKWYTYILASMKNGTLYVWVTSNLEKRIFEHKNWVFEWFTKKYNVHLLVWYQEFPTITEAIEYEKVIKKRRREKKIMLIESTNPWWEDLAKDL